jgi:hypothetical protein
VTEGNNWLRNQGFRRWTGYSTDYRLSVPKSLGASSSVADHAAYLREAAGIINH